MISSLKSRRRQGEGAGAAGDTGGAGATGGGAGGAIFVGGTGGTFAPACAGSVGTLGCCGNPLETAAALAGGGGAEGTAGERGGTSAALEVVREGGVKVTLPSELTLCFHLDRSNDRERLAGDIPCAFFSIVICWIFLTI